MITKIYDYVHRGNFREALIIGQNLFARDSGNPEIFKAYVDVLESVMKAEDTECPIASLRIIYTPDTEYNEYTANWIISPDTAVPALG